jgi:hypothetical protein
MNAFVTKHLSGHMYRGSAHETDSDCGNCDGARCEGCTPSWEACGRGFPSYEEAKEVAGAEASEMAELCSSVPEEARPAYWHPMYFVKEDLSLWVRYWNPKVMDGESEAYLEAPCNPKAPSYEKEQVGALARRVLWDTCTYPDKGQDGAESQCCMCQQCDDARCFRCMRDGRKKPIYM